MNLLNFIDQAVRQIKEKQQEALKEFSQGFFDVKLALNHQKKDASVEVSQSIKNQNQGESHFKDSKAHGSDHGEDAYQNTERNLPFFEKIANKNSRALDDFFNKLKQVKIQTEPIVQLTTKQTPKLNQKPQTTIKKQNAQQKKKIISFEDQDIKSTQYHKTIDVETPSRKRAHYIQSLQMHKQKELSQNPQDMQNSQGEKQKTASQILSELNQIHRQRSIQRMQKPVGRSLNKRTRILKIGSEMQDMMKEKKQKQAEQKIKVNLEFLQRLRTKPQRELINFKEFKNTPTSDVDKLKQSIRIKTIKKTGFSKPHYHLEPMTQDLKLLLGTSGKINFNDSNIFMDSRLKLPQLSPKKGSLKPKPYSIYNVTQRGNEMFFNK